MASKSAKTAQDILMADFQALVRDTEKLLADTANLAGDQADELREQIHERLTQARETLQLTQDSVRERGQAALGSAEQYVQENPWQAIGIAAGVGLLIGLLANRRGGAPMENDAIASGASGKRLGAALLGLLHSHIELFGIELQEQKARTLSLLLFAGLALVFALLLLTALSGLLLVLLWDSYRLAGIVGLLIGLLANRR